VLAKLHTRILDAIERRRRRDHFMTKIPAVLTGFSSHFTCLYIAETIRPAASIKVHGEHRMNLRRLSSIASGNSLTNLWLPASHTCTEHSTREGPSQNTDRAAAD
jgi:hypothetical protein